MLTTYNKWCEWEDNSHKLNALTNYCRYVTLSKILDYYKIKYGDK